jgi:hypothetical protein
MTILERVASWFTSPSEQEREHPGMVDFYQRALRDHPSTATGIPPPIDIQVEERQVTSGRLRDAAPPTDDELPEQSVLAPPPPGITSVVPNVVSSAGGDTVTINGNNFTSGSTVKIAGLDATSVVFVNATKITCTTPADGIGFVSVEVTAPSGQTASLNNALRYTNQPDNVLIEGPTLQRSEVYSGYDYPYTMTLRIGERPLTIPVGATYYLTYVITGRQNLDSLVDGPTVFYAALTNATGPSANLTLRCDATPFNTGSGYVGGTGYVDIKALIDQGGGLAYSGPQYPTYGDPGHAPNSFRILFNPTAPYPPSVPSPDHFAWSAGPANTKANPFGWLSGDINSLSIRRLHSNGTLDTTYNGTATLSWSRVGSGIGELGVTLSATITFASGVANLSVSATYTFTNAQGSQGYGYFFLRAVDGSISGNSPTCACLNHL